MMEGLSQEAIAEQLGTSRVTVRLWQKRYQGGGIQALLKDAPRSGRIPRLPEEKEKEIIEATLHRTPADATHCFTMHFAPTSSLWLNMP